MGFSNTNTSKISPDAMLGDSQLKITSLKKIALVLVLSFATLWLNGATAAHMHLDGHDQHQGELCLSLHSNATALETNVSKLIFTTTKSKVAIDLVENPQLIPVAPCNSRAPPFQL